MIILREVLKKRNIKISSENGYFSIPIQEFENMVFDSNDFYNIEVYENEIVLIFSKVEGLHYRKSKIGKNNNLNNRIFLNSTAIKILNKGITPDTEKIFEFKLYTNDKDKIVLKKI